MKIEEQIVKELQREQEIKVFYKLAAENGFTEGNEYVCINCEEWIEGSLADCSKCK